MAAKCSFNAKFGERIGDDGGGCQGAVGDFSEIAAAVAEKQFVSDQPLFAIQYGLAPKK